MDKNRTKMTPKKLKKMEAQVRIGGKGTPRRKKKFLPSNPKPTKKKFQSALRRLWMNNIGGVNEATVERNDRSVIHFEQPQVLMSRMANANTLAITGQRQRSRRLCPRCTQLVSLPGSSLRKDEEEESEEEESEEEESEEEESEEDSDEADKADDPQLTEIAG